MVPHGFIEFDLDTKNVEFVKIFDLDLIDGPCPPDYVTVTDDMLEEGIDINDFKGDNVRIKLNRDYSRDELLRMKKDLEDAGIQHVKLSKVKEEKIDLASGAKNNLSLYSPEEMFNRWLEHDSPKKLDIKLLKKLNNSIVNEK